MGQAGAQGQRDKSIELNEALVPSIQVIDLNLFSCSIAGRAGKRALSKSRGTG